MVRQDPADPVELGERGKDVVRKPEPDEHGAKHEIKKVGPRNAPDLAERPHYGRVARLVESGVEGNSDKRCGPDAVRGVDQEASAHASHSIADEICGEGDENLVGEMSGVWLVEILRQILHPDNVVGVWRIVGDVGHDGDEHVLFARKRPWVQTVLDAEEGEASIRKPSLGGFADGIGQQLGDIGHDTDGRLPNVEELIHKGEEGAKQ